MKFQVSNLFRKKDEPAENNAVEAETYVAEEASKAEPATEQTVATTEEEVTAFLHTFADCYNTLTR